MLSWLAPEPISREIFTDHRAAVNELIDYSMIRWDAGTNMLQVHRLVQEISRSRIPADERSASLQAALHAINTAAPTAPDDVRPWPVWNLLRPHVSELIAHADQNGITDPTVRLMNDLGTLVQLAVAIPALAGFARSGLLLCQSCIDVCHWLCQCFLQMGSTGKASGTQPMNECMTEHYRAVRNSD